MRKTKNESIPVFQSPKMHLQLIDFKLSMFKIIGFKLNGGFDLVHKFGCIPNCKRYVHQNPKIQAGRKSCAQDSF